MGRTRTTEYAPRTIRAPVSPPPDHQAPGRSPQGRLRRRPRRPGCARSLTRPAGPPRTWQPPGKQETPVTHAQKQPPPTQTPFDTAPLSFREDTEGSLLPDLRQDRCLARLGPGARFVALTQSQPTAHHPVGEPPGLRRDPAELGMAIQPHHGCPCTAVMTGGLTAGPPIRWAARLEHRSGPARRPGRQTSPRQSSAHGAGRSRQGRTGLSLRLMAQSKRSALPATACARAEPVPHTGPLSAAAHRETLDLLGASKAITCWPQLPARISP